MSIAGSEFWRGTILRRFFKSSTAVAAALVAMLVFTSAEAQAKTRALSNAERLIVEKAIKDTLVDPDSAKFEIKPLIVGSKLACRTEERRVGTGSVSTRRYRWSPKK